MQIDFIFNDNVPILCYPAISKSPKQLPNYLKITETSVVLIVFNCVSYDVSTYTVTVSFCRSTWIRYQKCFIKSFKFILVVLKIRQLQDKCTNVLCDIKFNNKLNRDFLNEMMITNHKNNVDHSFLPTEAKISKRGIIGFHSNTMISLNVYIILLLKSLIVTHPSKLINDYNREEQDFRFFPQFVLHALNFPNGFPNAWNWTTDAHQSVIVYLSL